MQQSRNHLIFFLVVLLVVGGYFFAKPYLFPTVPVKKDEDAKVEPKGDKETKRPAGEGVTPPAAPAVTPAVQLLALGSQDTKSEFELFVRLDPLGGGVRQILLNKFQAADENGRPTDPVRMLELLPDAANQHTTAFALYHYDVEDSKDDRPLDTLARVPWKVVETDGKTVTASTAKSEDGKKTLAVQSVSFQREIQGVVITKTFSLREGDYHVGLTVSMHRPRAAADAKPKDKQGVKFRYQLAGARGLPVEGKWYTSVFRNAYIGEETEGGSLYDRQMQELRQISVKGGGDSVERGDGRFIRYAGVAVQYFASVIVVDTEQEEGVKHNFLKRARPTMERGVVRGKVKATTDTRIVVEPGDGKSQDESIFLPPGKLRDDMPTVGAQIAVVYQSESFVARAKECLKVAVSFETGSAAEAVHSLWEDDITIRVNTDFVELEPGDTVAHKYVLYHGPVKPSLLRYLGGDREVDATLIGYYADKLHLNSMTDYPASGIFGNIGRYSGFSWLVIWCTNAIHRVLGWLTWTGLHYGLCILLLTVLVRGMMFPLSRKQAMMGIKMQALAPEVKAIGEKFKDDQQARGQAVMELYKKRGVNPLGSCWIILLQMPVFMGLYYALQESILFRLAPFTGSWVVNLAAPDMMIFWGRTIPMISANASYGGFIYLGPYLNLLPIVAVALMLVQQKMMTPPPADEQQEMQQKMMKWMMVIMCLMFYKVAAGLCIYFIASSLWGFAERKLLPKAKKTDDAEATNPDPVAADVAPGTSPAKGGNGTTKKPGRKRKEREKEKAKQEEQASKLRQWQQSIGGWWKNLLDSAKKKG